MGGRGRTLILEDDETTRALFLDVLTDLGIPAATASLDVLPEADGFGVVITDLPTFPLRTYSTTAANEWVRLLRDRYAAAVIVVTGHTDALRDTTLLDAAFAVIAKPLSIEDLEAKVTAAAHANV